MGGDNAPRVEVEGVAQALRELPPGFLIQLVGRTADIEAALKAHGDVDRGRLQIVEAPDVVGMGEKPLAAVKRKPRSSIAVGLGLQKRGDSDAFLSAGNTGAVMAAATLMLRLHEGVQRAAIGTLFPTAVHPVLVLDSGANVDCDARELVGFAHLGSVYVRDVLDRPEPGVGLLNVGEEDEKGNAAAKEAHQLLKQATGIHYVGNVEGRDILAGARDHERRARRGAHGGEPRGPGHRRRAGGRKRGPMKRPFAELWGTGSYTPKRVMTNDEFSTILDTSDQWIRERTGIRERRVAGPDESNACMAKAAAEQVLKDTGLTPLDLDALIVATCSPDRLLPSQACDLQALQQAGLTGADIDLLIPHQANIRIIEATAKHAGLPMDKVYVNVDRFGNTSAASVAIALDEAVRCGRLQPGMKVMFCAFGAGFTWASMVVQW